MLSGEIALRDSHYYYDYIHKLIKVFIIIEITQAYSYLLYSMHKSKENTCWCGIYSFIVNRGEVLHDNYAISLC